MTPLHWNPILGTIKLLVFLTVIEDVRCIKLTEVTVPQYVSRGDRAVLHCLYDMENDRLYSVTWSKDGEEFYRFEPKRKPPQIVYEIDAFKIDRYMSSDQQLVLRNVNLGATGSYKCEVSAEAPSFISKSGEGYMDVVSLPKEDPAITGEERFYRVGDIVALNCTSDKSYPPARLKWYINDEQMIADYEASFQHHGLVISVIGLKFEIMPHHFLHGKVKVKCASTITTGQDAVVEKAVHLHDNREALFLVRGGTRCTNSSVFIVIIFTGFCFLYAI